MPRPKTSLLEGGDLIPLNGLHMLRIQKALHLHDQKAAEREAYLCLRSEQRGTTFLVPIPDGDLGNPILARYVEQAITKGS
jgi:hypothetical protein